VLPICYIGVTPNPSKALMDIEQLQAAIDHRFLDVSLLSLALTHSSFLNENPGSADESNERLEFLGDAVIGLAVAEALYSAYPNWHEGQLTQARAALVREETLAEVATEVELGAQLRMGRGEEAGGGRNRPSNLSAGLEAVVGAAFLDSGYDAARDLVLRLLSAHLTTVGDSTATSNPKSVLQESVQGRQLPPPSYEIVSEAGQDHDRTFMAEVTVDGKVIASGVGKRKAQAEQAAASNALAAIEAAHTSE